LLAKAIVQLTGKRLSLGAAVIGTSIDVDICHVQDVLQVLRLDLSSGALLHTHGPASPQLVGGRLAGVGVAAGGGREVVVGNHPPQVVLATAKRLHDPQQELRLATVWRSGEDVALCKATSTGEDSALDTNPVDHKVPVLKCGPKLTQSIAHKGVSGLPVPQSLEVLDNALAEVLHGNCLGQGFLRLCSQLGWLGILCIISF
jgi:hypothetical protein